jgi:acetyl esterase/lipase
MRKGLFVVLALVLVLFLSANSVYGFPAPVVERDVIYCSSEGPNLLMDLYYPDSKSTQLPVVVYVHGGGWYSGDKNSEIGQDFIPELIKRGYLVVAINYRLAPRYEFPAQIEDLKCAVRFLRENAETYGLDPQRIGVFGESAGGHLAALLGVTDENSGFDCTGNCCDQSSRVKAVVDMFGPADLTLTFETYRDMLMEHVFGTDDPESNIIKRASPVTYISSDDAPFLIIQGQKDGVVLPNQSEELYQKLVASNVPASLVMVKNAGHEFVPVGGALDPNLSEIRGLVGNFFDQYLK